MGESKTVPLAVTPLGKGCAAKNAAVVTVSAPRPLKKCVTIRHTQTQLCTTRTGTLTETHHKQCAAQRVTCVSKSAHVRAHLKFSPPSSPNILPGLRCTVTWGRAAKNAAVVTVSARPSAKKVCDSQTHTQTQLSTTSVSQVFRETKTGLDRLCPFARLFVLSWRACRPLRYETVDNSVFVFFSGAFGTVLGYDGYVVVRIASAFFLLSSLYRSYLLLLQETRTSRSSDKRALGVMASRPHRMRRATGFNPQWVQRSRSRRECVQMREETEWMVGFLDHS